MPQQESARYRIAAIHDSSGISGCYADDILLECHRGVSMWLTFCCLHSLQALRLPPRRLPVTGGVLSISPESGLLCMNSTPAGGRGSVGVRKSPWGIDGGPLGAKRFRYSRSIEIGQRSPGIKSPWNASLCSWCACAGNRRNQRVRRTAKRRNREILPADWWRRG